jgi:hypothetical protein
MAYFNSGGGFPNIPFRNSTTTTSSSRKRPFDDLRTALPPKRSQTPNPAARLADDTYERLNRSGSITPDAMKRKQAKIEERESFKTLRAVATQAVRDAFTEQVSLDDFILIENSDPENSDPRSKNSRELQLKSDSTISVKITEKMAELFNSALEDPNSRAATNARTNLKKYLTQQHPNICLIKPEQIKPEQNINASKVTSINQLTYTSIPGSIYPTKFGKLSDEQTGQFIYIGKTLSQLFDPKQPEPKNKKTLIDRFNARDDVWETFPKLSPIEKGLPNDFRRGETF